MIKRADPEAIVMVGTYGPCAEFIKLAHRSGFHPTFVNISFVGANALAAELGPDGEGVIVSQVVPFPWDRSLQARRRLPGGAARPFDPTLTPDFVSLEGYLVAPPRGRGAWKQAAAQSDARRPCSAPSTINRPLRHQRQHRHRRHTLDRHAAEGVLDR